MYTRNRKRNDGSDNVKAGKKVTARKQTVFVFRLVGKRRAFQNDFKK